LEETQLVKFSNINHLKLKESQRAVDILFNIYTVVYGGFDKIIHLMDRDAYKVRTFPNWFMTLALWLRISITDYSGYASPRECTLYHFFIGYPF
jgi:hypothetical protein